MFMRGEWVIFFVFDFFFFFFFFLSVCLAFLFIFLLLPLFFSNSCSSLGPFLLRKLNTV